MDEKRHAVYPECIISKIFLYLWFSSDIAYYDGIKEVILAAGLVSPKPGQYITDIIMFFSTDNIMTSGHTSSLTSTSIFIF